MQAILLQPDTSARTRNSNVVVLSIAFLVLAAALAYSYYFVFSRPMSLDEGYLMVTVQGFNGGHALYDEVFTQYGPFYYLYQWVARAVLGIPLTHDATRFFCIAHWLIAAVVLGIAALRITRSRLAALLVGALAVVHLSAIANEPGHPQELVVVLLAFGVLLATFFWQKRRSLELLCGVAALLTFTKINVGMFFGFALFLAMWCHSSVWFNRRGWNWLPLAASAVLPLCLMWRHLSAEWCRNYGAVVACTAVVTVLIARRVAVERKLDVQEYLRAGASFFGVVALVLGVTLASGTSWRGLLEGLIVTPSRMPRTALLVLPLSNLVLLNTALSMIVAGLVLRKSDHPRVSIFVTFLKFAYALVGVFGLTHDPTKQLGYLLPWIWLVALPGDRAWTAAESFPRVFLCLAAAWQSLQAYPIAGTQMTLATFLPVLAYGICLSDAATAFARFSFVQRGLVVLNPGTRVLATVCAGVALLFVFTNLWCRLPQIRDEYARLRPLNLPGSARVHMDDESVEMYRALAAYLAAESDTFVTYPGINSLYLWTGKRPPTQLNSTGWGQLSHAQQEMILGSLAHATRPRIAVVEAMMADWSSPACDPIRPLIRFVTDDCRPICRIGRFVIFEPRTNAISTASR